jgi:tetratricopeptide (TPR) repeat protein
VALSNLGRFEEAMTAFQKCVDLNPSSIERYTKALDKAKGDDQKTVSHSGQQPVELDCGGGIVSCIAHLSALCCSFVCQNELRADVYANRAACNVQLYEPQKVRADCDAALKLVPMHVKALLRRGQALESLEKYKDALADMELALRVDPNNNMALQALTRIKRSMKAMGMSE